jgi:hypothetical protein
MLDTIILQIEENNYHITDYSKFGTTKEKILNTTIPFCKWTNNPSAKDKKESIYKPRLTLIKRGRKFFLKIEFSASKLLFDNNLDELEENDFSKVVEKLRKEILEMGVRLFTIQIEKAEVIAFHPSKNILLSKGYTASFAIRELSKINLNQKLDLEKVSFRNNGEALQFYSNRHSLVLYDKINDLNKPAKRAIDKDQTSQQLSLFDYIKEEKSDLEILRFEIRLSHRTKMKEVLEKVNFIDTPLFKNIFKKYLCQKVIKLYWNNFFRKDLFLFSVNNNPQKILQLILQKYPKTKPKTAVLLVGLNLLCKDDEGIRGLRSILQGYSPKNSWTPLRNYLRKFEDEIFTKPAHWFIKDIEKSIDEFKPFKLNK